MEQALTAVVSHGVRHRHWKHGALHFRWIERYITEFCSWHCKRKVLLENTQRRKQDQWHGELLYGVPPTLPKQAHASTPSPLFPPCPAAKMSLQIPSLLCCVSTRPAAGLSPLCQVMGTCAAGNPAGEMKEAWTVYETAGGKVRLLGPERWSVASLLPAWHLQTVTSPVTCHPMRPPWKLEKPAMLLTTPASPKKAPETYDQELPWLRRKTFTLGSLRSWFPGWNIPMKGKRKGKQTDKGEDRWCWCLVSALLLLPALPTRGETPVWETPNTWGRMSRCNSLHRPWPWLHVCCFPCFPLACLV